MKLRDLIAESKPPNPCTHDPLSCVDLCGRDGRKAEGKTSVGETYQVLAWCGDCGALCLLIDGTPTYRQWIDPEGVTA